VLVGGGAGAGCVESADALRAPAGTGATGAGGLPDGPLPAWSTCEEALALGKEGDACNFDGLCSGRNDCCEQRTACREGRLYRFEECTCFMCQRDEECPFGRLCVGGACLACDEAQPVCFPEWEWVPRHGCNWCVPPSACRKDEDCGADQACYGGLACPPECMEGDPSCCHGNVCAAPGCGSVTPLSCLDVGCPAMGACLGSGMTRTCKCDLGSWLCTSEDDQFCTPAR
jgi:hypothetical protein